MKRDKEVSGNGVEKVTLPIWEEEARLDKRRVETAITKVSVKVKNHEEVIQQPLMREQVEIKHVPINRFIDSPAQTRTEGDVTIIPVMEEVLVVEKRLRLKEEVHVKRCTETVTHTHKETVRKEEVVVEHTDLPH